MKVRYRAQAIVDLEAIFEYLEPRSPTGARHVLAAIYAAIMSISESPYGAEHSSEADIRVKVLGRYRYKIFYSVSTHEVEIIHIRHSARRPWPIGSD